MFEVRTYKNIFAEKLNLIFDGYTNDSGIFYDQLLLSDFLAFNYIKIEENKEAILKSVGDETEDVRSSILQQIDNSNVLWNFNDLLYKSVFLLSFSILDKKMRDVCLTCCIHNNLLELRKFKARNNKDKDLLIYRKYLESEMKVNFTELTERFDALLKFVDIRNCIVHSNSEIRSNNNLSYFKDWSTISVNEDYLYIKKKEFVLYFIEKMFEFLKALLDSMNYQFELIVSS
jgi:hypothetical protein